MSGLVGFFWGGGGERLAQQPSLLLILNYESAVTYTTAKDASLHIAVSNCAVHRLLMDSNGTRITDMNLDLSSNMDINVDFSSSMDHRKLLRRLNSENEPLFMLVIFSLLS